MSVAALLKQEAKLAEKSKAVRNKLDEEKTKAIGGSLIRCAGFGTLMPSQKPYRNGCGKTSPLRLWTLRLRNFWDENTGSPNGGFWSYGEPKLDSLICPKCGVANYINNHPQIEKILRLRLAGKGLEIFAKITESNKA